ncbi:DUF4012 domain-containing protein [Candidatus Woesebacteria bacterium]|nr:DUF4012 domain-containing protein [Candidatus Woesebacteria bacterium]
MDGNVEPVLIHKIETQRGGVRTRFLSKLRFPQFIKTRKKLFIFLTLLLVLILFLVFAALRVVRKGQDFYASAKLLAESAQKQDVKSIKENLTNVKKEYEELNSAYKLLLPLKLVPFFGQYVSDGEHAILGLGFGLETGESAIAAFEPYADILGFNGTQIDPSADGEKTAQERLDFIVKSLPEVIPKVDLISEGLTKTRNEIDQINPDRYPKSLFGQKIQEPLAQGIKLVDEVDDFVKRGKPLLSVSPYLLGAEEKRQYLVLFQNDKELRPTGGFMTAYSIADVEKGKFQPVSSSDMYSLDAKYRPSLPASQPIIDYIKGPYAVNKNYRLRDMNWSPDFKESIELFLKEAEKVGIKNIDGVIGVDTYLLVNILEVLGPIGVPGYGNFSNNIEPKCNCPQVIYELESFADVEGPIVWDPLDPTRIIYAPANIDNRKKIIGPLMNSILANSLAQPKEKIPALFNAIFKSVTEKHVLLYIHDDTAQAAAESFGIAGRVSDFEGDYLHINDANLGGRKSNLYVTQEVRQEVKIGKDGTVEKTLEIIYKNPQDYDGWLNSVLPNWTRVYLPKGSEIIDASGFDAKAETYEEFGKTVVAGGFQLRPKGISTITISYKLPFKVQKEYQIMIQKQPGADAPLYSIEVNGKSEEAYLRADTTMSFKIK